MGRVGGPGVDQRVERLQGWISLGHGCRTLFPLTFATGTFVPVDTLPGWLQSFTVVNPLTHLVDVLRGLLLGGSVGSDVLWTLGWMAALLAVFVPLALPAYGRRV